jgi:predicted aldo/keto reductase-like oxidoreductase
LELALPRAEKIRPCGFAPNPTRDYDSCSANYMNMEENKRASSCLECGKCETACPQHLSIRQYLKDAHQVLAR